MANTKKPDSITIMGITYSITYTDSIEETDIDGNHGLYGQIDYKTRTIRLFDKNPMKAGSDGFVFYVLIHEMLHGIAESGEITPLRSCTKGGEEAVDLLASILSDTLMRNGMVTDKWKDI